MKLFKSVLVLLSAVSFFQINARGAAYSPPPGGWTYFYDGDQLIVGADGSGFSSLDGTWSHDNGSDTWDGSEIGGTFAPGNGPGGVNQITDSGVNYIRIQDTGDPRDYGYPDPSNRKVYFGHSMTDNGAADTVLDDGLTLTFRARIPTNGPLDGLHRDGQQAGGVLPYPPEGDGYVTSDGGKGNFVLKQAAGGAIAFSLTQTNDTTGGAVTPKANFSGLTMNEFAGNQISGNVNFGQGTATNVIAFDPTQWHEFWIVIRKDPANVGTHQGFIYLDGSTKPIVFKITAGNGDDYAGISYLAIGMTATPQNAALDIDFVGFALGAQFPGGSLENLPPEILDVQPPNGAIFYDASNGISFRATTLANNSLPTNGFKLTLNGQDVSAQLNVSGTPQDRTVTFTNLQSSIAYKGTIIVSDQSARSSTNELVFDTFSTATTLVIEAEDYNYDSGKFLSPAAPEGYAGLTGFPDVDYHDNNVDTPSTAYRADFVGLAISTDVSRQSFTRVGATDYMVNAMDVGEWLNYTRNFPNGVYNLFLRAASTAPQEVELDKVSGDTTTATQSPFQIGSFAVPTTANTFGYVPLTDAFGSPVALNFSGTSTLRLTGLRVSTPLQMNFLMLAPANGAASSPYFSSVSPASNAVNVPRNPAIRVTIANGSTSVSASSVRVSLNGTDVTSSATITGGTSGVTVAYVPSAPLNINSTNTVKVAFQDTAAAPFERQWTFTTIPFEPIITSVVETDGDDSLNTPPQYTGQTYVHPNLGNLTVPVFQEDAPAYRDRTHQWNGPTTGLGLPPYLAGGEYIMNRNDNRDNIPYQLDVTVSAAAKIYVLVDNRLSDGDNSNPPDFTLGSMSWLLSNGWAPVMTGWNRNGSATVPDEVGVDEGGDGVGPGAGLNNWASVYVKSVPAGMVSLFQSDTSGQNMYGVVVRSAAVTTKPIFGTPTISGNGVTITWTGGGKLQETTNVASTNSWSDVAGNPQGTYTTPATDPHRFYRVVVP